MAFPTESRPLSIPDRIGLAIFDRLMERGVTPFHAAAVAQTARAEVMNRAGLSELFVTKVTDQAGQPHACVVRELKPGSLLLFRLDIQRLREAAERE